MQGLFASVPYNVGDPNIQAFNSGTINQARRAAVVRLEKTETAYTLTVFEQFDTSLIGVQTAQVIEDYQLAHVNLQTNSQTKTYAQLAADKQIAVDFVLCATPNPEFLGGYQVYIQLIPVQINQLSQTNEYQKYQSAPLSYQINIDSLAASNLETTYLFFDITYGGKSLNVWFNSFAAAALSNTWSSASLIFVENGFKSTATTSTTLQVVMYPTQLDSLAVGVYWFPMLLVMNPYVKSALQDRIDVYNNLVSNQLSYFQGTIGQFRSDLENTQNKNTFTDVQIAFLSANQILVINQYKEFLSESKLQYQAFKKEPNVTALQKKQIDQTIAYLDAQILIVNAL